MKYGSWFRRVLHQNVKQRKKLRNIHPKIDLVTFFGIKKIDLFIINKNQLIEWIKTNVVSYRQHLDGF